jgi:hypothetical protein
MSDDANKVPTFSISKGNLTHLHGAEVPSGMITVGNGLASAKSSSPEQTDWAVNGAYDFAERLRKP